VETFNPEDVRADAFRVAVQPVPEMGQMTQEHAEAILAVIAADKKMPQLNDKREIIATQAEAEEIARRVWWRTKLYSSQGLGQLFPGLKNKTATRK
jgi:hypothetical protein